MELLDVGTAGLLYGHNINADDVDGASAGAVTSTHITIYEEGIMSL